MSKNLEKLNKQKKNLEEKIEKLSEIANARQYDFDEIYDHTVIPFVVTRSTLYEAGEVFNDVYDNLEDNLASHSKAGKAIATGVNYTIAGAAAAAIGVTAVPLALLESVYSVPVIAYQYVSEVSKQNYNNRISKAKYKLIELKEELENVNSEIAKETQGLEK